MRVQELRELLEGVEELGGPVSTRSPMLLMGKPVAGWVSLTLDMRWKASRVRTRERTRESPDPSFFQRKDWRRWSKAAMSSPETRCSLISRSSSAASILTWDQDGSKCCCDRRTTLPTVPNNQIWFAPNCGRRRVGVSPATSISQFEAEAVYMGNTLTLLLAPPTLTSYHRYEHSFPSFSRYILDVKNT